MYKFQLILTLLITLNFYSGNAQTAFTHSRNIAATIQTATKVPADFLLLSEKNDKLRDDFLANEKLIDLVQPFEADSQLTIRKQWHRVGPLVIPLLVSGYNWRAVRMTRQKFVGSTKGGFSMSSKEELTEFDITFNLFPHIQQYKDKVCESTRMQIKTVKGRHAKKEWASNNFSCDSVPRKHFHCELTPQRGFRESLNELFFPTIRPNNLKQHVNFGEDKVSMGVFGVQCLDCNHSCSGEIHPVEWVWWLDLHPGKSDNQSKRWVVGLLHEGSNRFKQWAKPPRVGTVAIPFLFKADNPRKEIYLNPLVMGKFEPAGLQMLNIPPSANDLNFSVCNVDLNSASIKIYNNQPLYNQATKWWLSDVQTDGEWIWGFFNLAVSNNKVFTFKLEQSPAN